MQKNVEKMSINYSPNFNIKKRSRSKIKYLIYHYTGMKSENAAIKRLTNLNSKVSCHYLIKINGEIKLGAYILISPGTSIRSAKKITIGESTMIASDVTITDSDWHGIYDRTDYVATPKEVIIEENVWIGEKSIILKGTKIGKNSIIGAGSVVSGEVPDNVVFAGNPAREIKKLDKEDFVTRKSLFSESSTYLDDLLTIEKKTLETNTFFGWIKSIFWPKK